MMDKPLKEYWVQNVCVFSIPIGHLGRLERGGVQEGMKEREGKPKEGGGGLCMFEYLIGTRGDGDEGGPLSYPSTLDFLSCCIW